MLRCSSQIVTCDPRLSTLMVGDELVNMHKTVIRDMHEYVTLMRVTDGHVFEVRVERLEDSFELVDEQQFDDVESDEATE